ncbi:glycosyltransferase family 39 protein [Amycolatopsis sp. BJA-103]|uniref:ArnT family glycosyltransferase n=1 Tax=Amycolatopsis sp. BJA-103 TaxID=1911175 RepID=UPI000CA23039|nr:glycosyltransferase family 39 protein [Amycolatopsis sp. BJA-103]AUI63990.1 mannosyltransferase [Amycolatopsis sp. BJA-103]PNE16021.1 mannosyltransferase [Amycolatopsis sp. BJA-103]
MSATLTHLPSPPSQDPAPESARSRWAFWRSPADQPQWARPALLGIAFVALVLYAWNLPRVDFAPLYSDAAKSMSESWKAFFYGAVDPGATYTLDKLAGSFVPQALSIKIFGYHEWAVALPQVIEGVISVLVMYRVVRRWAGVVPGLLAAGIFTLTPVLASMFGHSMQDGLLTMCLVLAVDAYQRAVLEGRLRSLVWAGVWVGIGFQAKMVQAWMILPALAIGYLLTAPVEVRRRVKHVGIAGVVTLAVSLSWIALYTFTPASARPTISGTTNNSAFAMVFGYNGLGRVGIHIPGAEDPNGRGGLPSLGPGGGQEGGPQGGPGGGPEGGPGDGPQGQEGGPEGGPGEGPGGGPEGGQPGPDAQGNFGTKHQDEQNGDFGSKHQDEQDGNFGPKAEGGQPLGPGGPEMDQSKIETRADPLGATKLLDGHLGVAIAWLFPLALLSLLCGLWWWRRAERTDPVRGGLVMWGVWLVTFGFVFSASAVAHTAYVASLAPAIAALSALGIVTFWRAYRSGGKQAWILPVAIAANLAWGAWLWSHYPNFLPWAKWGTLALGVAALVVLILARLIKSASSGLVTAGLVIGVVAMLAAPATYAVSVLDPDYSGSSFDANAGPASGSF